MIDSLYSNKFCITVDCFEYTYVHICNTYIVYMCVYIYSKQIGRVHRQNKARPGWLCR